jgi:hypothetical protein
MAEDAPDAPAAPKPQKKIAIIGTAPHWKEAPFDDPEWQIWVASYGLLKFVPRWDVLFEIHDLDRVAAEGMPEELSAILRADQGRPIITAKHYREYPNSTLLPRAELEKEFGEFFFTSTFAWMWALAIQVGAPEIGLWGVDCAADGEYFAQRPGAQFFLEMCRQRNIPVTLPATSLLRRRAAHYGVEPVSAAEIAMRKRLAVLKQNREAALNRHRDAVRDVNTIEGAIAVLEDLLHAELGVTDTALHPTKEVKA